MVFEHSQQAVFRRRTLLRGIAGFGTAVAISKLTGCTPTTTEETGAGEAGTEPVKLGLVAAITGSSALSGESIKRD